jgi:exoribonuclease R
MQFYKEYSDNIVNYNNKLEVNILNIDKKYYYRRNNEIILIKNNRAIHGDKVLLNEHNNEVINIIERINKKIVGILYLDSKIKYGFFKDKMLYLFKPTDTKYTDFYVPYKGTYKNKIYVTIEFKEWKITDKLPIGTLIDIIGDIGNEEVEYEHLRNYYDIKNNVWKINNEKILNDANLLENIQNNKPNYFVFSIDPLNSKDIDDSFHYNFIEKDIFEIGIHIASPFKFFYNYLEEILNRVSTIYLPHKKYNLLPNIYADNYLSLLEGKNRFALSLILKINNSTKTVLSYNITESIVKNIKNYNYDEFDILIKKGNNKDINKFIIDSKNFFNYNDEQIFDSHKLVEEWMIYTNKFIAKYLINKYKNNKNIILRVLYENKNIIIDNLSNINSNNLSNINSNNLFNNSKNLPDNIIDYLKIKKENSAIYEIYNNIKENDIQIHYKLGNEYYTHFTSPIRRAVDLFIHGLIMKEEELFSENKLNNYLEKINIFTKQNRKFNRQIKRLEFLFKNKNNKELITYGYIIKISKNKLSIYLPEYNFEEKIIIIPYVFEKILHDNIIYQYDNDNNITFINYSIEDKEYSYKLYDKLNIKLWIFLTSDNIHDKLKLEII